jgi:hypothetical protein
VKTASTITATDTASIFFMIFPFFCPCGEIFRSRLQTGRRSRPLDRSPYAWQAMAPTGQKSTHRGRRQAAQASLTTTANVPSS